MATQKQTYQEKLQANIQKAQQGHKQVEGDVIYTFENHRNHDLSLPRKSFDDKTIIPPRGKFKGDAYFLMLMKTGYVRLVSSEPYIRNTVPAAQPVCNVAESKPAVQVVQATEVQLNENAQENTNMQKLILDQPPRFTATGESEKTVANPNEKLQPMREQGGTVNQKGDVLLTENPLDGIDIITG